MGEGDTALSQLDLIFAGRPEPPTPLSGEELRDSEIASVLSNTPEWYRDKFIGVIRGFPVGYCFTAEDVRTYAGDPPESVHHNCVGGLIRTAAGLKLITRTQERRKAKRAVRHASEFVVWRRL